MVAQWCNIQSLLQNIYFFCQTKTQTIKQKAKEIKENRKTKEAKEEKEKKNVVATNNVCGKSNGIG